MRTASILPEAKASFESSFIRRSVCRRSKSTASITTSRHTCRSAISLDLNMLATAIARRRNQSLSRPRTRTKGRANAAATQLISQFTPHPMSEPVLPALGFTVSELPHNVRHAMHPCGFRRTERGKSNTKTTRTRGAAEPGPRRRRPSGRCRAGTARTSSVGSNSRRGVLLAVVRLRAATSSRARYASGASARPGVRPGWCRAARRGWVGESAGSS